MEVELRPLDFGMDALFDIIPDAAIIGDVATGRILLWNPAAAATFGYPPDAGPGMFIDDLVAPRARAAHRRGMSRFADRGPTPLVDSGAQIEVEAVDATGKTVWVELRLARVPRGPGGPDGYVLAVMRDVTARRQMQQWLEEAAADASRRSAALEEFFSTAAHDLQSPLGAVSVALQLLIAGTSPERHDDLLALALRQTGFLSRLVDDIISVATLEVGAAAPETDRVDAARAVADAVGADDDVVVDVPAGLVVRADALHVNRMLQNLVSNAQKYGASPISVSARPDGSGVRFDVVDTGSGVPADVVDRLFEPFARGGSARATAGSGLGLAAVRGLAAANGGRAWHEAVTPHGSRFSIWLPAP